MPTNYMDSVNKREMNRLQAMIREDQPSFLDRLVNDEDYKAKHYDETKRRLIDFGDDTSLFESRLAELDTEWSLERALQVHGGIIAASGLALGLFRSRVWLALPFAVLGFFLQQSASGWNPAIPGLRRLGYRSLDEINQERSLLRAHLDLINANKPLPEVNSPVETQQI